MEENVVSILYIGRSADAISELSSHPRISLVVKSDAMAAFSYLESDSKPDAVLCELNVPGGDGFEIFKRLRKNKTFEYIAFILICHEFKEDVFKDALLGRKDTFNGRMDDFYVLPLENIDGLVSRIHFLINFKKIEIEVPRYHMPPLKKLFDIVVSAIALICLSPVFIIVPIAIMIESKGWPFYKSKRIGKGLDTFDFYKFRSMRTGAADELDKLAREKNQYATAKKTAEIDFTVPCPECSKLPEGEFCSPRLLHNGVNKDICENWFTIQTKEIAKAQGTYKKISDDPRVTKVGKFIRNTSIDELPQLINVLKGDMSIVGNRPLPVYEAEKLTFKASQKRFHAPAGITGLWQVELRGKGGVMSDAERGKYDNDYADHFSGNKYRFFYDLKLIRRTAKALFQKDSV